MGKHIKHIKYIVILVLFGFIYLFFNRDMFAYNPMKKIAVTNPSYVVDRNGEGKIVIDKSGQRFYRIDRDGRIPFLKTGGNTNEKGFYRANCIVTDTKGSIYVLDIVRVEGGRQIGKERILKYTSNGKFEKVLLEVVHDEVTYKNKINKLFIKDDRLYYLYLESDRFVMADLDGNERTYPYKDANLALVDFSLHPTKDELVYVTKNGEVRTARSNGGDSLLYKAEGQTQVPQIPWAVAHNQEGILFFADIGTRTIYELSESGVKTPVIYGYEGETPEDLTMEDIKKSPIFYRIQAQKNLVTTDSYGVCAYENGEFVYETEYALHYRLVVQSSVFWLVLFLTALGMLFLLFFELKAIYHAGSMVKAIAGLLAAMLLITAVFSMIIVKRWTERMSAEVMNRALAVAKLTAELIPTEDLKQIDSVEDFMSPCYQRVRDSLRNVYVSKESWTGDLYYVVYRIQKGMITGAFSIEDYLGTIYPYDWEYEGSDEQYILEKQESKVYSGLSTSEGNFIFVLSPIIDRTTGESVGLIEVGTDLYLFQKENNQMIFELFLNAIVMSVVIIMIAYEVMNYLNGRNEWQKWKKENGQGICVKVGIEERRRHRAMMEEASIPVSVLRMLVFLIFFVTNMTRGFFPLYMIDLIKEGDTFFNLSTEMLIAIPMAAEVLFGAIFSMGGNVVLRFLGRRKSAIAGSLVFVIGLSLRALFPNILMMIIGNAVMGCGWGILLLIVQVLIAEKPEDEKNEGFAGYTASSLNGMNSGVVFGAFLIGWIRQQAVFGVVSLLSLLVLFISLCYIYDGKEEYPCDTDAGNGVTIGGNAKKTLSTVAFLFRPKVISYFLMIVVPVVICGYFLSYLFPIVASDLGISETNIGYSFLVNGIIVICFGKTLTVKLSNRIGKQNSLALSAVLYGTAFLLFAYYRNIPTLILTLVVLGISDSFGLPTQASYYTDLHEVRQYGYDRAMGVYSLFENMSQTAGSFIFGYVLLYGVQKGLNLLSVILFLLAGLFLVVNLLTKKGWKKHA